MARILTVCSLKSSGTSTLILGLAGALARTGRGVRIVDMTRNEDLSRWAEKPGRPKNIRVASSRSRDSVERQIVEGLREEDFILLDAGLKPGRILAAAGYADLTLIPVRFSPLSAYWAVQTDALLGTAPLIAKSGRRAFVATGITQIPSRIARQVEARIGLSRTAKLPAGLMLRAAQEAPFLHGGTLFTLSDDKICGLDKARSDVVGVLRELGMSEKPTKDRIVAKAPTTMHPVTGPPMAGATPCASGRKSGMAHVDLRSFRAFDRVNPDPMPAAPFYPDPVFVPPSERAYGSTS